MHLTYKLIPSHHGRIIIYWTVALLIFSVVRMRAESPSIILVQNENVIDTTIRFRPPVENESSSRTELTHTENEVEERSPAIVAVDINNASLGELQSIRGIGPVLAERIIQYREENGIFDSIDKLVEVRGIGPVTVEKIKTQSVVAGR